MYRELYIESQEWIYISSREEVKITNLVEEKRKQEKLEVSSLDRRGLLGQKRLVREKISNYSLSIKVERSRLHGFLRSRCIDDALTICLPRWKADVSFILAREHVLSCIRGDNRAVPDVKENLMNEMAWFAFSASHPAEKNGLNRNILTDMIWSLHMCLCKNLSLSIQRDLISPELEIIREYVFSLIEPLLFFWDKASRVGPYTVPINESKEMWRKGNNGSSYIKLLAREVKFPRGYLIEKDVLEERKAFLEKSLKFKTL